MAGIHSGANAQLAQQFNQSSTSKSGYVNIPYVLPLPKLNINYNKELVNVMSDGVTKQISYEEANPVVLKMGGVAPHVSPPPAMIGATTIVPQMTTAGVASGIMSTPLQSLANPFWSNVGVLLIKYGGRIIGQLATDLGDAGVFAKIGKKLDSRLSMGMQTGKGEGAGRYVRIRGADGAVGGDHNRGYDQPQQWFEFWKTEPPWK